MNVIDYYLIYVNLFDFTVLPNFIDVSDYSANQVLKFQTLRNHLLGLSVTARDS